MNIKHRVNVNLCRADGTKERLLTGADSSLRSRILTRLLGNRYGVLVLVPGESTNEVRVEGISGKEKSNG